MIYDLIRTIEGPLSSSKCLMNKKQKRFLWFKWSIYGAHDWEVKDIGMFMPGVSTEYTVEAICKKCGKWNKASFVPYEALMKLGYTRKELETFRHNKI